MRYVVALIVWCIASVGTADDALKNFPQQIFLVVTQPRDVSAVEFARMTRQAELTLRKSGFTVRTGSYADYERSWREAVRRSKDADDFKSNSPGLDVLLDVTVLKSNAGYVYSSSISIVTAAWLIDGNGPDRIKTSDGLDVAARAANVILYSTRGTIGISPEVEDVRQAVVDAAETFANDWLKANPK